MSGTFSLSPVVSDPDMLHGTCVTHVPWCMPGSLTNGFLCSRWWGKRSLHSRSMRNLQFYVSDKRPMGLCHEDAMAWKRFMHYWPFVRGYTSDGCGTWMIPLMPGPTNCGTNIREACKVDVSWCSFGSFDVRVMWFLKWDKETGHFLFLARSGYSRPHRAYFGFNSTTSCYTEWGWLGPACWVYLIKYDYGFAVLCFAVATTVLRTFRWLCYPYSSGLVHWHTEVLYILPMLLRSQYVNMHANYLNNLTAGSIKADKVIVRKVLLILNAKYSGRTRPKP